MLHQLQRLLEQMTSDDRMQGKPDNKHVPVAQLHAPELYILLTAHHALILSK